jgi:hypothetical protein
MRGLVGVGVGRMGVAFEETDFGVEEDNLQASIDTSIAKVIPLSK